MWVVTDDHERGMSPETCAVCGGTVPFAGTVHVLVHPNTDEGPLDHYVCRACYEEELAPLFE